MVKKNLNLGILFSLGESFYSLKKTGQDLRFINEYLKRYGKHFKTFIFSYKKEKQLLPPNCFLLENKLFLHRFIYQFFLPFYYFSTIKKIDVFRVMQLTGVIPAILIKIFYHRPFFCTYGYDYSAFAKLEGQKIKPMFLKILEKLAIKYSSGIIITTRSLKNYLAKQYPQANLIYIPNGVDIKNFNLKSQNPKPKTTSQNLKLLFVGRLEKQKNLVNLIKAVSLLSEKCKIKLLFIGQGKLKLQLIKLAKKERVDLRIIDKIPHDQMSKYYWQADIFVLPSFLEGHPKALLEAMACGLPCLVGRFSGVEEFRDKEEILVTGFTPKEISQKIELLWHNKKLRKLLSWKGRKRVEKDFDIATLLDREINILANET